VRRAVGPLTAGDREILGQFEAFLRGELACHRATGEFVAPALAEQDPDTYYLPPPPTREG
jgi:hypothetical protein